MWPRSATVGGVAHPDAEDEPVGKRFHEGTATVDHSDSVPRPDVGDARCQHQVLGCGEEGSRLREGFLRDRFRVPQSLKSEPFDGGRRLAGGSRRHHVHLAAPYPDSSQVHLRRHHFHLAAPYSHSSQVHPPPTPLALESPTYSSVTRGTEDQATSYALASPTDD